MKRFSLIFACLFFAFFAACERKPISELSPEEGIQRLRSDHQEKDFERVINDVNEYRSRFPYTQYAAEAELIQADAYFQDEKFPEAVSTYEEFLKKNPSHKEVSLATFRVARSYDLQSPEQIDREQLYAIKAIDRYNSFLERFPQTQFAAEAKERLAILRRRVADHNVFVARFYWKKGFYQGALARYLTVLKDYSTFDDLKKEATEFAAKSYLELAQQLEEKPNSDMIVYFKNQTPSELRKKAQELQAGVK